MRPMYAGRTWRATASCAKLRHSSCSRYARTTGCSSAPPSCGPCRIGPDVRIAEHRVKRRRRDIGPVRLHVGKVQHPRRVALRADPVEREIGHVRGLGVLLGDARRQVHVAHLPSRREAAAGIDGDHVLAPRIGALVATRTQVGRVARLGTRRRMAVVAVEHGESALAQQRAALRFDFDPEARERLVVRQHMRLAGKRRLAPRRAQIVAERVLRGGQRHAVPRRAVRAHVAPRVVRHARGPAHARLDERVVETHAERGEPIEVGRGHPRLAVAGDMIAPQLVAHHEQHVADGSHRRATGG